jgi:hypothetical protein
VAEGSEVGVAVGSEVAVAEGMGDGSAVSVTSAVWVGGAAWVFVGRGVGGMVVNVACGEEFPEALQAESNKIKIAARLTMNHR